MSGEAALAAAETAFTASRHLFDQVTDELGSVEAAALTHSQLEDLLSSRMREVTRQLFQDHVRLRELTEQRLPEVVDAAGVERTRIERGRSRILATVFGKVTVTRIAYRGNSVADLHPADAVPTPARGDALSTTSTTPWCPPRAPTRPHWWSRSTARAW